ncbi:MAG: hypothetical protein ACE5IH_02200 [Thermodesulfobacteriota bacterium]
MNKLLTVERSMIIRCPGIYYGYRPSEPIKFKEILSRPQKDKPKETKILKPRKKYIPPKDHPWRKYPVFNKQKRTFLIVLDINKNQGGLILLTLICILNTLLTVLNLSRR